MRLRNGKVYLPTTITRYELDDMRFLESICPDTVFDTVNVIEMRIDSDSFHKWLRRVVAAFVRVEHQWRINNTIAYAYILLYLGYRLLIHSNSSSPHDRKLMKVLEHKCDTLEIELRDKDPTRLLPSEVTFMNRFLPFIAEVRTHILTTRANDPMWDIDRPKPRLID